MKLLLAAALVLSLRAGQLVTRAQADLCTAATNDPTHCICSTPDGVIDVTSLGNPDKSAKYTPSDKLGFIYDFNPCYGLTETDDNKKCRDTVACQKLENGRITHGIGDISTGEFYYDNSSDVAYLMYINGEGFSQTKVNLVCDMSQDTPLVKTEGDAVDTLTYVFTITHKCACPGECRGIPCTNASGTGGIAVIVVGAILAILGTVCGVVGLGLFIGALVMITKNKSKAARYEALQNVDSD